MQLIVKINPQSTKDNVMRMSEMYKRYYKNDVVFTRALSDENLFARSETAVAGVGAGCLHRCKVKKGNSFGK